jgi:hypothetical protein
MARGMAGQLPTETIERLHKGAKALPFLPGKAAPPPRKAEGSAGVGGADGLN